MGYFSTMIFHGSLSTFRAQIEHLVIAGCGGDAKEVAEIAFRRIAHNLHRRRYQIHSPTQEIPEMHYHLGQGVVFIAAILDQPSSVLYEGFKAHSGWVKIFLDIISYLLSAPHHPDPAPGNKQAIIISSMNAVTSYIDNVRFYGGLLELLESSFLDVVSKATLAGPERLGMAQSDYFTGCWDSLFQKIAVLSVYRSFLCRSERCIRDTAISTWIKGNKAPMAMMLLNLQSNYAPLVDTYKDFRKSPHPIFCCGNRLV